MAKHTVLEIVDFVLQSMGSDTVNSIDSTAEAGRVAAMLENVYYEMIHQGRWEHLQKVINLEAATSPYPNYLTLPDDVMEVHDIRYDKRLTGAIPLYQSIQYCEPEVFLNNVLLRDPNQANVTIIEDYDGSDLYIKTDIGPTFWTSFDGTNIAFDSWDFGLESELASSKSRALVTREPVFVRTDDHIPDLPNKAFPQLIAETKSVAFYNLRQAANEKAEQASRRQRHFNKRQGRRTTSSTRIPNFGRGGSHGRSKQHLFVGRNNRW